MREKDSQTIDKENEREREREKEKSLSDNAYLSRVAYSTRQEKAKERERRKENIVHYLEHTFVDNEFFKNQPFQFTSIIL